MKNVDPRDDVARFEATLRELRSTVEAIAVGSSVGRRRRLLQVIDGVVPELTQIARRPDEPEATIVRFHKYSTLTNFGRYVALRGDNALWHTSAINGATNSRGFFKPYRWDELLDWLDDEYHSLNTLEVATSWEKL